MVGGGIAIDRDFWCLINTCIQLKQQLILVIGQIPNSPFLHAHEHNCLA